MTWVDFVALAVVLLSAVIGFFRGMVREVLGVGAWVGAAIAALVLESRTTPLLAPHVSPDWLATALAIGGVFIAVLVVLKILIHFIANLVQRSLLGGLDRALGLVFGVARGAFIVILAYIVGGLAVPDRARWPAEVLEARALPYAADGAAWLIAQLPPDFRPPLPDGTGRNQPSLDQLLRPPARDRT